MKIVIAKRAVVLLQPIYFILLSLLYLDCKACFHGKQGAQPEATARIDSNENFELAIVFAVLLCSDKFC